MYEILDWPKLFPKRSDEESFNPTNEQLLMMGQAIGYYLSKPQTNPITKFGNEPTLLQNFRTYAGDEALRAKRAGFNQIASMQNLAPTSFNQFWSNLQDKYITGIEVYDEGWKIIFREMPLDGNDFWEVRTVATSITFEKIPYGGDIKYYSSSDSRQVCYIDWYGAGVGIDRRTLMTRKFVKIEDDIRALRNQYYLKKAQVFYGLIEAVNVSENVAWQAPLPALLPNTDRFYTANRDAMTINVAIQTIINDCKNKGYSGDLTKETYICLYDYRDDLRLKMAKQVTMETGPGPSTGVLNYNVVYIPTMNLSSTTYYYVILPKRQMQYADILDLSMFMQFNQTNFTEQHAGWGGYGGTILDIKQVKRCLKS